MEFSAKALRISARTRHPRRAANTSLFDTFASRYAQDNFVGTEVALDPNLLQVGQSVYDNEGTEKLIVEDPDGTTNKVLMDTEQAGGVPVVETIEDAELGTQYSLDEAGVATVTAETHMDLQSTSPGTQSTDETDGFRLGESGYVEIMRSIQDMKECDYQTIDIILNIGELYDRDLGTRVLEEARRRGIL